MVRIAGWLAIAAAVSPSLAAYQGFNYGSTFTDGSAKQQSDFEAEFRTAQGLVGAPAGGFTSARLYTTVQAGTPNSPISAIPAAIATKTTLLLGLWASAGDAVFANELVALSAAITQYGKQFTGLVAGISVGSEDLYRDSDIGRANGEYAGASAEVLAGYIKQLRAKLAGTALSSAPVGHVDTWTEWVKPGTKPVIDACDWVGVDAYPYFESTHDNAIGNNKALFFQAYDNTKNSVGGKPVWVTETGFPVSGKTVGAAIPSLENAKTYWDQVGCPMFGSINVWWFTMQDAAPATPNPSFGLIGSNGLTTTPLYDISCKGADTTLPSSSAGSSASASGSGAASGSGSASGSGGQAATAASIGGGSPGASGLPQSQLSIESAATTNTDTTRPTGAAGAGAGGGGSAAGGLTTSTTTVRPGSSTTSASAGSTQPSAPNGGAVISGSMAAAALAIMAVIVAV